MLPLLDSQQSWFEFYLSFATRKEQESRDAGLECQPNTPEPMFNELPHLNSSFMRLGWRTSGLVLLPFLMEHSKQAAYILGSSSILQLKVWPVRQLLTFCPATCLRLAKDLLKNKLLDIQLLKNLPNLWCYWIKPLKYLSTYRTSRLPRCTDPDQKWTLAPDLDFKKKVLSFPFSSPFNLFSFLPFSKCGTAKIPVARS